MVSVADESSFGYDKDDFGFNRRPVQLDVHQLDDSA